jgi:hypothetical protein
MNLNRDNNKLLIESVSQVTNANYLTEEDINAILYVLLEEYTEEEIMSMTEEQLCEGFLDNVRGRAEGIYHAAKKSIKDFSRNQAKYSKDRINRYETQSAEKEHSKQKEQNRIKSNNSGIREPTDAELHAVIGKLSNATGSYNQSISSAAKRVLQKRMEAQAQKGLGGFIAKFRGVFGNKDAMKNRIEKLTQKSAEKSGRIKGIDAGKLIDRIKAGDVARGRVRPQQNDEPEVNPKSKKPVVNKKEKPSGKNTGKPKKKKRRR